MTSSFCVRHRLLLLAACTWLSTTSIALAQRELKEIPPTDPELERRELQVADGFEIQLYAADPLLAKPIQMNFDARGRLWIAASEVYPQIRPGQPATDKILVLEDTDGDGQADSTTVFADGLLIPTGVLPGDGGCYVANSTELLHLRDTDGDGRADHERVVLSGFGTEDTHHILHTLRWGPDGALYMNQSIYIHSHLETPTGVKRMNGSGVWRFRPTQMDLEVFTLGLVNPWGTAWDRFGATFETDGAGGEGINYVFPGFVGMTSPGAARIVNGLNPGKPKLCGLEVLSGSHLPDDWQGNLIANDFRAHRVCRYAVTPSESGYSSVELDELVKSTHVAFRPIDVKMGPDGAIYIADWYNPIIQHGEVDFRDPRRDHVHGRIWRITAKDRPLVPRLDLTKATVSELVQLLNSPEPWRKQHARQLLKEQGAATVQPTLDAWTASLAADDTADSARLEALWTYQAIDQCPRSLLLSLLNCSNGQIRAAATRVLGFFLPSFADRLDLLAARVVDEHPRVRLEAVRALSRVNEPHACEVAMRAARLPRDRFLDFCLWETARDLQPVWLRAFERGEINFGGDTEALLFALQAVQPGSENLAPLLNQLLNLGQLTPEQRLPVLSALVHVGDAAELGRVFRDEASAPTTSSDGRNQLLRDLIDASRRNKIVPAGDLSAVERWLKSDDPTLVTLTLEACGAWKLDDVQTQVTQIAKNADAAHEIRRAAIQTLADFATADARSLLRGCIELEAPDDLRLQAAAGILQSDVAEGAEQLANVLSQAADDTDPSLAIAHSLEQKGASDRLAIALEGKSVPRDVALKAVRSVLSSGRNEPQLVTALTTAGQLSQSPWQLPANELSALLSEASERGDAHAGEQLFRRADLTCQKCHGIGGAGGQVGPDLASLGASAQPDYILESILEPGKKIKENYHSLIVETDEGRIITGIKLRESDTDLILRNAEDQELRIALASIENRADGGSLMPQGLLDNLTRTELLNLVRFLSELGKVGGDFTLPRTHYVRRWQVLQNSKENVNLIHGTGIQRALTHRNEFIWQPAYSLVAGPVPCAELPALEVGPGQRFTVAQSDITLDSDSELRLADATGSGLAIWVDGKSWDPVSMPRQSLGTGSHTITIVINAAIQPVASFGLVLE